MHMRLFRIVVILTSHVKSLSYVSFKEIVAPRSAGFREQNQQTLHNVQEGQLVDVRVWWTRYSVNEQFCCHRVWRILIIPKMYRCICQFYRTMACVTVLPTACVWHHPLWKHKTKVKLLRSYVLKTFVSAIRITNAVYKKLSKYGNVRYFKKNK